jgi:hypothetical protein
LNQHALTRAAAGLQGVPSQTPYANNPNAYFNRVRDNGFVSHYDVQRRRPPTYGQETTAPRRNTGGVDAPPAAAEAAPRPLVPLASFFDAAQKLVWPNESPTDGDLKEKRDHSDQASLAVLEETRRQPVASISSVTYARQVLIDYGQPALKKLRTETTPVIADTFHIFLLALYDSLAQAAGNVDGTPITAPTR